MRRGVWAGLAVLVAVAAAIPLWFVIAGGDGGERRPAALEEQTLDCGSAKEPEACARLQRLLDALREDLGALDEQLRQADAALEASGDDAQLANVDLQNILQKQQQNLQMMSNISMELSVLGDDAQLANVDLQNILQKQQQTLQMMSNISKMLYDTAQSVIRKMGG
jgi:hypothetical protein